jgi:serine O-acetyltransferase
MELNPLTIGLELKKWFSKSIYDSSEIDFDDHSGYKKILEIFRFDYNRYYPNDITISLESVLKRHELVGILLYRCARYYYLNGKEKNAACFSNLSTFLSGFEMYYTADIGKGLKINHGLGTVIGTRSIIGENALIHHGVTLGDKNGGRPTLGNNVIVYPGAKILGAVQIGDNSIIGANSVCMISAPENSIIAGNPAKILTK